MHKDCERCGVFGWCNEDGICSDCLMEEYDEQEEETEEGEAEDTGGASVKKTQNKERL